MAAYTLVSSGCLLFNPSGRTQLVAIASTLPMDNNVKAKCTFRGKPSLRPSLMDHAKMLPTTTGDTALDVEAAVIARPFMVPNISLLTVLFTIIPVELNENPTFNFMSRRIPISKVQRTVDLL